MKRITDRPTPVVCVADRAAAYVAVIDVKGLKVMKSIPVGAAPWGVANSQR
jgi:YVTN family beta-propeller protein